MKPVRLELEGFTAFRGWTEVDFDGADLFALSGPTGAGKTSVIDAMTFALYGAVPRLDERAVAPVISQGLAEARVRFTFTVGGVPHVAVRVVRSTKSGATTKEARLERGDGTVLAGDARGMTAAVTELLGLDFKQFTTCVSLPQGEFARFLHAEPRHRQDLLVKLLDLGLYEQVAQTARQRAALANERAAIAAGRLEKLADATPEAKAAAAERAGALGALREAVQAAEPELAAVRAAQAAATAAAEAADRALRLLGEVRVPDGVGALSSQVAATAAARRAADEAEDRTAAAVVAAESVPAALPARAEVLALQRDRSEEERLARLVVKGQPAVAAAAEAARAAAEALEVAQRAEAAAAEHLQAVRTANVAHGLAAALHVGDDCPVCGQVIGQLPDVAPDLRAAEAAAAEATRVLGAARSAAGEADTERARVEAKLAGVVEQLAEVRARLAAAADGPLAGWLGAGAAVADPAAAGAAVAGPAAAGAAVAGPVAAADSPLAGAAVTGPAAAGAAVTGPARAALVDVDAAGIPELATAVAAVRAALDVIEPPAVTAGGSAGAAGSVPPAAAAGGSAGAAGSVPAAAAAGGSDRAAAPAPHLGEDVPASRAPAEPASPSRRGGAGGASGPAEPAARLGRFVALLDAADELLAAARRAGEAARQARGAADRAATVAAEAEARARRDFESARDALAALEPPPAERADLAADWAALAAWAEGERPRFTVEQRSQRAAAAEHEQAAGAVQRRVTEACTAAGVEPGSDPRGAVADALARAEAEVRRIEGAIEEAAELRAASASDLDAAHVATSLAGHLAANRFERWLLEEALAQLVAGATQLLHELSGGAYSLAVDDKGTFVVVDHVNAEQVRSARTLSGGETFLTSLALALALADQVATLAAGGAARLETMLLDEGFGTLDPEALDTVAAALEELGARGRTVGIVTHVQELADRMPVRFDVRKVAGAATVTRVDR